MSKVLITGAQGFLGVRLASFLKHKYEVRACSHVDLDITDFGQVESCLKAFNPEYVVHCAAISDTGLSQSHPELSMDVNVKGTVNIASACVAVGAKLIYMSSDQVYNGTHLLGGLREDAPLNPQSVYGNHKLSAEQQVSAIAPDAVGLRLTWMYDLLDSPFKLNRNILYNLQQASNANQTIQVAVREHRGITWVWDVVHRLPMCFELPGGAYNFGCENDENSYSTFKAVARMLNLENIDSLISKDELRFPDYPRNLSMNIDKLRYTGIDFPKTIEGFYRVLCENKT